MEIHVMEAVVFLIISLLVIAILSTRIKGVFRKTLSEQERNWMRDAVFQELMYIQLLFLISILGVAGSLYRNYVGREIVFVVLLVCLVGLTLSEYLRLRRGFRTLTEEPKYLKGYLKSKVVQDCVSFILVLGFLVFALLL